MLAKARFMRAGRFQNQSLHYVNSYAVLSRIDHNHLPDIHPDSCINSPTVNARLLLPSFDDDSSLWRHFMTYVSLVIHDHMKYFKFSFDGIIDWHIKHQYYKEMSTKSKIVSY